MSEAQRSKRAKRIVKLAAQKISDPRVASWIAKDEHGIHAAGARSMLNLILGAGGGGLSDAQIDEQIAAQLASVAPDLYLATRH